MNFHILTLFPEMVSGALSNSIIGRAIGQGKIGVEAVNIRDFSGNKHNKVDDYTYGGGAGMLMQAQPVYDAWENVCNSISNDISKQNSKKVRTIYVTPQGTPFNQNMAKEFSKEENLIILCGHYEGIDERALEETVTDYVSVGDFVLTGGELAAMIIVDAVARLVPGVLHNDISAETESFHGNLLEYPQYSRPKVWKGKPVPDELLTGNTKVISKWRQEQSEIRTRERRPDLYEKYQELQNCKKIMMKQKLLHIDMIEIINRGRAELVYHKDNEILLKDLASDVYFHTNICFKEGEKEFLSQLKDNVKKDISVIVLHQEEYRKTAFKMFGFSESVECYQAVYTQKEKMSVTGLYRTDKKPTENGVVIMPLRKEDRELVADSYDNLDEPEYIYERMDAGALIGAYVNGKLAGYIGTHEEGSIGILTVLPEYRHRKIAMALQTYIINKELEEGKIPYGQVKEENEASIALQKKLGLYLSKQKVFWVS